MRLNTFAFGTVIYIDRITIIDFSFQSREWQQNYEKVPMLGYAWFSTSGQWNRCNDDPKIIAVSRGLSFHLPPIAMKKSLQTLI